MCLPAIAAVAAIASAASGFVGAQQQADAQNATYEQNVLSSRRAAIDSWDSQITRRSQIKQNADQNALTQSIEALQKRATGAVAAGEAGVTGSSVDAYIQSIFAQEGRRYDALDSQFQADQANLNTDARNTQAQAEQRINSVRQATDPSPIPFILNGISGAIGAFNRPGAGTV